MRGGQRSGAGRKKTEETLRLSVPIGAVDEVKKLIALYKQRQLLINSQKIKQPIEQPVKPPSEPLIKSQEIKQPIKPPYDVQAIRALLERKLKAFEKKAVIKAHGSLFQAACDGVRFDNGLIIPPRFSSRYELLGFDTRVTSENLIGKSDPQLG